VSADVFGADDFDSSIHAAVVAVVVVHMVIGLYVYRAWQEEKADILEAASKTK
jgi:hypothetical protein